MTQQSSFYEGVEIKTVGDVVHVEFDGLSFQFKPGEPHGTHLFRAKTTAGRVDELICVYRHIRRQEYPLADPPENVGEWVVQNLPSLKPDVLKLIKRALKGVDGRTGQLKAA